MNVKKSNVNGRWYLAYQYRGRRYYRTVRAETRSELRAEMRRFEADVLTGGADRRHYKSSTLWDLCDYVLTERIHRTVRETTYRGYKIALERVRRYKIASLPAHQLKRMDFEELTASLLREYSCKSTRSTIAVIRQCLDIAVEMDLIESHACTVKVSGSIGRGQALSESDLKSLLTHIESIPLDTQCLLLLCLCCGLRRSEALGVMAEDLEGETLHIRRGVHVVDGQRIVTELKTPSSRSTVVVPKLLMEKIRRLDTSNGYLFTLSPQAASQRCARYAESIGIRCTLHSLRHTYASLLIAEGLPVPQVQLAMRHSSPTVTLSVYTHLLQSEDAVKQKISTKINQICGNFAEID